MGKENLLEVIAREEARLATIEKEREEARGRIAMLRGELTKAPSPPPPAALPVVADEPSALRVAEKLVLFRSLFRGRDDVFPKLWTNPKGKKGYAPACKNEWVRGVCEKPRIKCGECPNQAFLSVTDQVLLDHLQERNDVAAQLAEVPEGTERLLLATGRYIGEGFDDARLDTLFLALPISWKGTLVQYTGRLHRLNPGKREVRIFDYVDREVPVLFRMFEKRLKGYRAIGYVQDDEPFVEDTVLDWDQDGLRSILDGGEEDELEADELDPSHAPQVIPGRSP